MESDQRNRKAPRENHKDADKVTGTALYGQMSRTDAPVSSLQAHKQRSNPAI